MQKSDKLTQFSPATRTSKAIFQNLKDKEGGESETVEKRKKNNIEKGRKKKKNYRQETSNPSARLSPRHATSDKHGDGVDQK